MFNVKEKLYTWDGGEEDLTELNKVATCIPLKEENRQQYEERLCSHVHVCACKASFYWHNMKYIAFANIPGHRQVLLYNDKWQFQHGIERKNTSLVHITMWLELDRVPLCPGGAEELDAGFTGTPSLRWSATGHSFLPHNSKFYTFLHHAVVCGSAGLQDCGF